MKRCLFLALFLSLLSSSAQLQDFRSPGFLAGLAGGGAGSSGPPPGYILEEGFEGTGFENADWTENVGGGNTSDEDYTGTVLNGSQSLRIIQTGFDISYISRDLAADDHYWGFFKIRPVTIGGDDIIFEFLGGGVGTPLLRVYLLSTGVLRVDIQDGSTVDTVDALSAGTTYWVWVEYHNNNGANRIANVGFSTDGTRPTTGNKYASDSSTTVATTIDELSFGHKAFTATSESIFDHLKIDDEQIGNNP